MPADRARVWLQLAIMRLLPFMPGTRNVMEEIMKPVREAANALTLKPYAGRPAEAPGSPSAGARSSAGPRPGSWRS